MFARLALVLLALAGGSSGALAQGRSSAPRPASRPAGPASAPAAAAGAELAEIEKALQQEQALAGRRRDEQRKQSAAPGLIQALQSLNPDLTLIADVAVAGWTTRTPLLLGAHDPARSGFTLQAVELRLAAAVDPYFRFDGSFVFHEEGVELEEIYASTQALPWNLQVRAGLFLTSFGRINSTHPHTWDFLDQVLALGKFFGGEGNRGLGAELSVLLPLPWYVELLASVIDASGEGTSRSFYGDSEQTVDGLRDFQYTLGLRQFFPLSDDLSLFWGLSAALGPNASGPHNRTDILGTDLYIKYRPITRASTFLLSLQAEWMLRRRQVPGQVLQDQGLYAQVLCRLAARWAAAGRYEMVTGLEDDPLDPEWTGLRQRASANLTFHATEFSRLRLQYEYDRPSWRTGYHGVILGLEFAVGPHGAHKF